MTGGGMRGSSRGRIEVMWRACEHCGAVGPHLMSVPGLEHACRLRYLCCSGVTNEKIREIDRLCSFGPVDTNYCPYVRRAAGR